MNRATKTFSFITTTEILSRIRKKKKKKPKKYTRKQINSLQMVKVSFPKQAPSYIS